MTKGGIDRFITSGMDEATRRAIGHLPKEGHGMFALSSPGRTGRIEYRLNTDPRRYGFPPTPPADVELPRGPDLVRR